MSFRISALPIAHFAPLFTLSDDALIARGARHVVADRRPGYPCRVSLEDAAIGERLILVHHEHQAADTPFRAGHAVYIREAAMQAHPAPGEIPALFCHRVLSLRGFDAHDMMTAADLSPGDRLETAITAMLADPAVAYAHIHYAAPGCYAARADRLVEAAASV
ncbi:DUF1203 domain-containing protein [uncultured Sphingomonas sp.]|uniref:DUF1203 domain-containing protein n=1 Tax=uncultured Sphingomonas sp. TaxID=158754 RepID=UPI0035CA2C8C